VKVPLAAIDWNHRCEQGGTDIEPEQATVERVPMRSFQSRAGMLKIFSEHAHTLPRPKGYSSPWAVSRAESSMRPKYSSDRRESRHRMDKQTASA